MTDRNRTELRDIGGGYEVETRPADVAAGGADLWTLVGDWPTLETGKVYPAESSGRAGPGCAP
jgi:hypothetical protein